MLEERDAETRRADYIAVTESAIAKLMAGYLGADLNLPNYLQFMYPDRFAEEKQTKDEIIGGLIKKLVG